MSVSSVWKICATLRLRPSRCSALIAAIAGPSGCFGVIYIDNAMVHDHYTLGDLDYLMLITAHTAAVLSRLLT